MLLALRHIQVNLDDQFIIYRYAVNLARGEGLVYNLGQRMEGFSCFLYVVLLAGIFKGLGLLDAGLRDIALMTITSKAIGLVSGMATLAYLALFLRRVLELGPLSMLVALLPVVLSYELTFSSTNGLESGLVILLFTAMTVHLALAAAARAGARRNVILGGVFAVLLVLARSDGLIAVGAVLAAWLLLGTLLGWWREAPRRMRAWLAITVAVSLVSGAYLLFRYLYFGELLPNTYHVKIPGWGDPITMWEPGKAGPSTYSSWRRLLFSLKRYVLPSIWSTFVIALIIAAWVWASRRVSSLRTPETFVGELTRRPEEAALSRLQVLAAVVVSSLLMALYVAQIGGDWMPGHRYLSHFTPLLKGTVYASALLYVGYESRLHPRLVVLPLVIFLGLMWIPLFRIQAPETIMLRNIFSFNRGQRYSDDETGYRLLWAGEPWVRSFTIYVDFVNALKERMSPGEVLAVYEAGFPALFLRDRVELIDLSGLNSREIARPDPNDFFTENLIRVYVSCGKVRGAKDRLLLARRPRYIVFDTFVFWNCGSIPEELLDRRYTLDRTFPHNRLGFFSVYSETR